MKSSYPDFKVRVLAATAWTWERGSYQSSLLTVRSHEAKCCSSVDKGHKKQHLVNQGSGEPSSAGWSYHRVVFKVKPLGMFPNYSTLEPAHRQQATGMQVWDLNRLKTVLSSFPTCEAKQETNSVCQRAQVEGEGHHTFVGANMGWA